MMKFTKRTGMLLLLLGVSLGVSGCSDGANTTNTTLTGNVFKGPIDTGNITITDEAGKNLATSTTTLGKFSIPALALPSDGQAIFITSQSGTYKDEATGGQVTVGNGKLMTVFTATDLRTRITNNNVIVLSPETTLLALLVQDLVAKGTNAAAAILQASNTIQTQLIDGTSPLPMVPGDALLRVGDFTQAIPTNQTEALARNRAISFSYEAQTLQLTPAQVFGLITVRAQDLLDGTLDGKQGTLPLSLVDKYSATIDLYTFDQKSSYGLERSRLFNNTIQRLRSGNLSAAETAGLQQMGFNTAAFQQANTTSQAALDNTQQLLLATNLPAFQRLPVLTDEDGNLTDAYATYTLTATDNVSVTINAPGKIWTTPMMRYNGLQLPPVIRVNRGDAMTLNLVNNLAADTTIHWHGFKIPAIQDGGPDFPVAAAASKTYSFTMMQPAAPLWFHPHPDMKTGEQVYRGLAGVYLLDDAITKNLEATNQLPSGVRDIPVLVQDRIFNADVYANGQRTLFYEDMATGGGISGMLGSDVLVNGAILPQLTVDTQQYRLRLFNTSNARTYDFALSDGAPFSVVGTDGGLLPSPVQVNHIMLGAAERAEIVIDFSNHVPGDKVMLISQTFSANMMSMMGGGNNAAATANTVPSNGTYLDIMRFDVGATVVDNITLYTALPANADINTQRLVAADSFKTRHFVMGVAGMGGGAGMGAGTGNMSGGGMGAGMGGGAGNMGGMNGGGMNNIKFVINGTPFDINTINEFITLANGDTEIWSIQNMSPMAHPFHAHAIQWQILDRNGIAATGIDLGWKDTVLVQPGETVRFIGRFDPTVNLGKYMYHCHILEHEDAGMMGFFDIKL